MSYRVDTVTLRCFEKLNIRDRPTRPSENFNNKPKVYVNPNDRKLDISVILGTLRHNIENGNLDMNVIKMFLIKYFEQRCVVRTSKRWESFGQVIVDTEDGVETTATPLDCISIEAIEERMIISGTPISFTSEGVLDSYAAICFGLSRYNEKKYDDYKKRTLDNLMTLIQPISTEIKRDTIAEYYLTGSGYVSNHDFRKLVAAFDMFICHFKTQYLPYSKLRQMTIHSYNKDCGALEILEYTMDKTGLNKELKTWFWLNSIVDDFKRINKEGEELDKHDSYRPWAAYFKLMTKSPYSTIVNPSITFFCHAVCLVIGSSWSENAMLPECNPFLIINNAALFIYAKKHSNSLRTDERMPRNFNAYEWYDYFVNVWKGYLPDVVLDEYYDEIRAIKTPVIRNNTILQYMKTQMEAHFKIKDSRKKYAKAAVSPKISKMK